MTCVNVSADWYEAANTGADKGRSSLHAVATAGVAIRSSRAGAASVAIAVLPLPILALLWSSRAQGRLGVGAALSRDSVAPVPGRRFGRERTA